MISGIILFSEYHLRFTFPNVGITAAVDGSPSVKRRSRCSRPLISLRIFEVFSSIEFSRMCIYIGPAVRQVHHHLSNPSNPIYSMLRIYHYYYCDFITQSEISQCHKIPMMIPCNPMQLQALLEHGHRCCFLPWTVGGSFCYHIHSPSQSDTQDAEDECKNSKDNANYIID